METREKKRPHNNNKQEMVEVFPDMELVQLYNKQADPSGILNILSSVLPAGQLKYITDMLHGNRSKGGIKYERKSITLNQYNSYSWKKHSLAKYGLALITSTLSFPVGQWGWSTGGIIIDEHTRIHPFHVENYRTGAWINKRDYEKIIPKLQVKVMEIHQEQFIRFRYMQHQLAHTEMVDDVTNLVLHYLFSAIYFKNKK